MYTASWTAARADVHSQQRFFCLMEEGEVSGYHWTPLGCVGRSIGGEDGVGIGLGDGGGGVSGYNW